MFMLNGVRALPCMFEPKCYYQIDCTDRGAMKRLWDILGFLRETWQIKCAVYVFQALNMYIYIYMYMNMWMTHLNFWMFHVSSPGKPTIRVYH